MDLWADNNGKNDESRNISKFKGFGDRSKTKVKAVVLPLGG